jgi:hypothetical protein
MSEPDEALKAPIEPFVEALGNGAEFPMPALETCLMRYAEAAPLLHATLERAATGELEDDWDDLLFFRALHIIGGRRDPLGFAPLLRFLLRPGEEVEQLLGDSISLSLPQIVAGVYDGNAEALFDAIADPELDPLARESLFGAATFMTWEGRIDRARMVAFLHQFDRDRLAPDGDMMWDVWAESISLLGLREMVPAVEAARARGSLDEIEWDEGHFEAILLRAEQTPDDIARFKEASLGYIDDIVAMLQEYALEAEDADSMYPGVKPVSWLPPIQKPAVNPMRDVGRNDPCPCGSGKKAKRCCLAA